MVQIWSIFGQFVPKILILFVCHYILHQISNLIRIRNFVLQERNNTLQKNLADNETAAQLTNLEKKLSHLEQNNFAIAEFVANKKAETR